jgi:hypothetical protein
VTAFLVGMAVGAALLAVVVKRRQIRTDWFVVRMNVNRWLAEHRAAKRECAGLLIIWPPVKNKPRSHRRPLRYREPRRVPDDRALELALWANDEANERLADADLPHFRQGVDL